MKNEVGDIIKFRGEHNWLSNFYECKPIRLLNDSNLYPSVEHAYSASKSDNMEFRKQICNGTAVEAKRFWKNRKTAVRWDWEEVKLVIMESSLRQKFSFIYHPKLAQKLLDTNDVQIIESNHWGDTFWGECPLGNGQNNLGKLLMKIRGELQNVG